MRPDKQKLLRERFPVTFQDVLFQVEDGWFDILMKLGETCEASREEVRFGIVKEKYARLTCYSSPYTPDLPPLTRRALKIAEEKSTETCEKCGNPGRLVMDECQWESIRCRDCQDESERALSEESNELQPVVDRYQKVAQRIWSLFGDQDPLGEDPAQGWVERIEKLLDKGLLVPKNGP